MRLLVNDTPQTSHNKFWHDWHSLNQSLTRNCIFTVTEPYTLHKADNNLNSNCAFLAVFTFLCLRKRWHSKFLLLFLFLNWWRMLFSWRTLKCQNKEHYFYNTAFKFSLMSQATIFTFSCQIFHIVYLINTEVFIPSNI